MVRSGPRVVRPSRSNRRRADTSGRSPAPADGCRQALHPHRHHDASAHEPAGRAVRARGDRCRPRRARRTTPKPVWRDPATDDETAEQHGHTGPGAREQRPPSAGAMPRPPAPGETATSCARPPRARRTRRRAGTSARRAADRARPWRRRDRPTASAPNPATRNRLVPDTVPLPTSRRSTPAPATGRDVRERDRAARKAATATPTAARGSSLPTFCRRRRGVGSSGVASAEPIGSRPPSRPPTARCAATKPCPTTARRRGRRHPGGVRRQRHIEDVTRRFAAAGYHAVAPDMFHRTGGGPVAVRRLRSGDRALRRPRRRRGDPRRCRRHARPPAAARLRRRADRHRRLLLRRPVTFLVAAGSTRSARPSGFYGGGIVTARFPQFPRAHRRRADCKTPWLGLFGDHDESIPVDDVEQLRAALDERAGRHRSRALRRRRPRLPLRRPRRVPRRGRGRRLAPHARLVRRVPLRHVRHSAILSALPRLSVVAAIVPVFLGGRRRRRLGLGGRRGRRRSRGRRREVGRQRGPQLGDRVADGDATLVGEVTLPGKLHSTASMRSSSSARTRAAWRRGAHVRDLRLQHGRHHGRHRRLVAPTRRER